MTEEHAEAAGDRPVVGTRAVDMAVSLLLLAFALLMAWDNWRTGASWAFDGPQAGYFPFYLSILLGGGALWGLAGQLRARSVDAGPFVTRAQARRVLQVLLPTLGFVALTELLGLYGASFLLVAGFMRWIGRIGLGVSVLTGLLFALAMFLTFEVAFDVLMPKGPVERMLGY